MLGELTISLLIWDGNGSNNSSRSIVRGTFTLQELPQPAQTSYMRGTSLSDLRLFC